MNVYLLKCAMQTTPPRNKRRKEARPQEILQAALQLFVEKGYAATKIEDIARAAGVTRGTPYLYFANKEELFKALIREMLLPKLQIGELMLAEHEGSCRELLAKFLRAFWTQMAESGASALPKLVLAEAGNFPDVAQLYHESFVLPGVNLFRQVLERGIASGEFRPLDVDVACLAVAAPIMLLMISSHSAVPLCADVREPMRYIDTVIDIALAGVLASKDA